MASRFTYFDLDTIWNQFCDPWICIFKWSDKSFDISKYCNEWSPYCRRSEQPLHSLVTEWQLVTKKAENFESHEPEVIIEKIQLMISLSGKSNVYSWIDISKCKYLNPIALSYLVHGDWLLNTGEFGGSIWSWSYSWSPDAGL